MPQMTDSQVIEMDKTLETLMNLRLKLTRINHVSKKDATLEVMADEEISDIDSEDDIETNVKVLSKYKPSVKWKEHFLSHFSSDIRNLAPLTLLNTDLFESKE